MNINLGRLSQTRLTIVATAIAVGLVLLVYLLARGAGDDLIVSAEFGSGPPKELEVVAAVGAATGGGIAGAGLAWLARRLMTRPVPTFLAASVVLLVGYGLLAFARTEQNSTGVWLNVMHLGAAIPIVGLLAHRLQLDTTTNKAARTPNP